MKKIIFFYSLFVSILFRVLAQSPMPCLQITPNNYGNYGNSILSGSCLEVGFGVQINGNNNKEMKAGESIKFYPNTHIAPTGNGVFHAYIEKNDFEVAWMEPSTVGSVGEYEKLEVGVKLPTNILSLIQQFFDTYPSEYLSGNYTGDYSQQIYNENIGVNPYNFKDINIQGIFTSPTGHYTIDGFYMKECQRNNDMGNWTVIPTDYNFRIRFAPKEQGNWSFYVKIFSLNNLFATLQSLPYTFNCIPSDNPGFLEVGLHKRYLRFNKTQSSFFPIGINTPSPSNMTTWKLVPSSAQVQQDLWTSIHDNGGNMVSLPFICDEYCYEWAYPMVYDRYNETGHNDIHDPQYDPLHPLYTVYRDNQYRAWEVDKLMDLARQKDLYIKVWVTPHQHTTTYSSPDHTDGRLDQNPYLHFVPGVNTPDDFFLNSDAKSIYLNYLRYMIARWGYSTNIAWWEVMSEVDGSDAWADNTTYWARDMGNWMKYYDNSNHLVSASYATMKYSYGGSDHWRTLYWGDITNIHKYGDDEQANWNRYKYIDEGSHHTDITYNNLKPVLLGEVGEGVDEIEACSPISFHNSLWATAFMGCMGTGLNWHWYPLNDNEHLNNMQALKTFLAGEDFESNDYHSERWSDGIDNNHYGDFESFQLINFNKTRGLGWVHNRYYWWASYGSCYAAHQEYHTPDDYHYFNQIPISDEKITIKGLLTSKKYQVDWYNTTGFGGWYASEVKRSVAGRLNIKPPDTDGSHSDWAYKITRYYGHSMEDSIADIGDTSENAITNKFNKSNSPVSITIFPNPSENYIIVEGNFTTPSIYIITDVYGKQINKGYLNTTIEKISIDNLSTGIYLLFVYDKDATYSFKITKL